MKHGLPDRANSAAIHAPCVLVSHSTIALGQRVVIPKRVLKASGPLAGAGPEFRRAGFAFVRLVQPAFRFGIAPSSSDRSGVVSTYSRSVLGARRNLRQPCDRIK